MQKYFKKLFSAFTTLAMILVSSITYIKPVQAEEGPVGKAVAYYWQSDDAAAPMSFLTIETALEYALAGNTIYLNQDWNISSPITIPSDTSVTIEMNGHTISRNLEDSEDNGEIFYLKSGSELHLVANGDAKAGIDITNNEIKYRGFNDSNTSTSEDKQEFTVKTGGLITGGFSDETAGAIYMESKSKLYLSNVAVNGNASDSSGAGGAIGIAGSNCYVEMDNAHVDHNLAHSSGGGIKVDGYNAHVVMKNNSTINYNQVSDSSSYYYGGGGIAVLADKFTLDMALSSISYNHVNDSIGGGIYIRKTATINMDHSSIDYNVASADSSGVETKSGNGGGIVVDGTDDIKGCLTLEGDYNSTISNNVSGRSGGGISLNTASEGSVIRKVIISNNTASSKGGGLYLPSNNNQINDCVLQNNTANSYGGGAYISQLNTVFRNCTIQNNHTNSEYGGGMYVYWMYDVTMHGNNIVDGNTNKDNKANNVYLDTLGLGTSNAYIKGTSLDKAHIGISTNTTSSRKVGEDIKGYVEGRYFLDNPSNLHLVYYADDTVYQEKGESTKYTLTVNGKEIGKYYSGEMVEINDRNTDSEKVFIEWDRSKTTGIDLSVTQRESQYFTISMPSNDVSTSATYLDRLKSLTITVNGNKPTAGKYLPEGMVIVNYGPESDSRRKGVDTEWLKVNVDSTMTPVSGRADYSTSYVFKLQIKKDINAHLIFSPSIQPKDITIKYDDGTTTKASSVSVDASGTITIISESITTANRTITKIDTDSITVNEGITKQELIDSLPTTTIGYDSSDKQYVLTVDKVSITDDMLSGLIDSDGKVIYPTEPTEGSATITLPVTAPQGFDIATDVTFNVTVNVTALPTIKSITEAYMTVKDGTSSTDFINELPEYAEVLASDDSIKFLEVDSNSLGTQLDAYLTNGNIDINKGTSFDIYLTVTTDGTVKNLESKTLKVTVTVNEPETVDAPTVDPTGGTYKDQLVDGNLDVTVSYGDSEGLIKGDTIHYIIDNGAEQTFTLDTEHTSCTITLEGTTNTKVTHTLEVWASGTDKKDSTHIKKLYVLDNSIVVTEPTVEPASGNYTGTRLTVNASTTQADAKIYYTIDNGDKTEYSSGIVLETKKDTPRTFNVKVWAEVSGVSSKVVNRTYILDGQVEPTTYTVIINCSDTAIVKPDETAWSKTVTQSYDKDSKAIIYAPNYDSEGRVFEKWIYTNEEGERVESTNPILTFDSLNENKKVQAIYNPVITEINFTIPYPVGGSALATKDNIAASATIATVSGKDITAYFDLENMSWLPNDETADYETSYTLKLPIIQNITNVRYVLADNITVKVNGNTDITANIDKDNLIAYISFPKTDIHRYNLKSVEQPEDITLSYAEAYKLQTEQEEESKKEDPLNVWNLPKVTNLVLDDDSKLPSSITWNIPQFNKESWSEQTIEVEGTVTIPSNVIQGEVSNKVTLKIHVEAPVQVSTPTSSIPTGTYKDTQLVTLKSDTENAKIYYTLDGTEPTTDSMLYEGSFKVKETTTIKAIAVYSGMIDSEVVTYTITIDRTPDPTPTSTTEPKKSNGWDDGGPFTTDTCGNVYDRWGNKIYEAKGCNVGGYNLVPTDTKE